MANTAGQHIRIARPEIEGIKHGRRFNDFMPEVDAAREFIQRDGVDFAEDAWDGISDALDL